MGSTNARAVAQLVRMAKQAYKANISGLWCSSARVQSHSLSKSSMRLPVAAR
jgi:hypothetical protein